VLPAGNAVQHSIGGDAGPKIKELQNRQGCQNSSERFNISTSIKRSSRPLPIFRTRLEREIDDFNVS
jgi:hypothetical protein